MEGLFWAETRLIVDRNGGEVAVARTKVSENRTIAPAATPEAREKQLVALAVDLAEKKLLDGTASNQIITHYLRLGSTIASLEHKKLEMETELLKAKREALESAERSEQLYREAMEAFKSYSGSGSDV